MTPLLVLGAALLCAALPATNGATLPVGAPYFYCKDGSCSTPCEQSPATCPFCSPLALNAARSGCLPCRDPNCERCSKAPGQCEFCRPGFYKLANGTCAYGPCTDPRCRYCQVKSKCDRSDDRPGGSCQAGFYANAAGACVLCPLANCVCTNSKPKTCVKCFRQGGHSSANAVSPCQKCSDPTCTACPNDPAECNRCAPGLGLLKSTKTRKHFCQGNTCLIANCESCGGLGFTSTEALKRCAKCIIGPSYAPPGGKCGKCKSPACEQCDTLGGIEQCYKCVKGYEQDYTDPDGNMRCVPEAPPCASGVFVGGKCEEWQMNDKNCVAPVRRFDDALDRDVGVPEFCETCNTSFWRTANYTCSPCTVRNCRFCRVPATPGGPTYCSQCLGGFGLRLTPTGAQTCQACPAGCEECQWVGPKVECLKIAGGLKYREAGGYQLDYVKKVAVPCADRNCFQCDRTTSSCDICKLGFILKKVGSVYGCVKFP